MIFTGCCCCCYFPGLVGIDVRMIFCLIFKWFTLFSCKLSRNKLVLIPLFRSLSSSTVHISSADYRQILLYIFLFAFHFNTLKHFFFHLRLLVVNSCCCWILRTSGRHCCFVFTICYYCRYKSVKFSDCECFLFFFSFILLVWV